jgi:hypothetical protein
MIEQLLKERILVEDVEDAGIVPVDFGDSAMGLVFLVEASAALYGFFEATRQADNVVRVQEVLDYEVTVGVEEGEFFGCRLAVGCHGLMWSNYGGAGLPAIHGRQYIALLATIVGHFHIARAPGGSLATLYDRL